MKGIWFSIWVVYCVLVGMLLSVFKINFPSVKFFVIDEILLILGYSIFYIASKLS